MNDKEQKRLKSLSFIHILINAIEKETSVLIVKNFFERLKEIIDSFDYEFLNKEELNHIFNKLCIYINNIKIKRNECIEKEKNLKEKMKNKKYIKEEEINQEYINDLIKNEKENLEEIQIEIADIIGILLKTHKKQCDYILGQIINNLIPLYLKSNIAFEIKIALYLLDDLIEYIGQEKLGDDIWEKIYYILIQLVLSEDNSIRQAAAYGIGIFSIKTNINFIKYSQGLIENLYKSLSLNNIEKNEDYLIAFDNIIAALGKIINYQFNDKIVQENINQLIEKWLMNLPLKYDEIEKKQQNELMVNLFISKRYLIPNNFYSHYFEVLAEIYLSKYSDKQIDNQIESVFINFVKKEEKLKNLLAQIYENASYEIKNKLNILAKK